MFKLVSSTVHCSVCLLMRTCGISHGGRRGRSVCCCCIILKSVSGLILPLLSLASVIGPLSKVYTSSAMYKNLGLSLEFVVMRKHSWARDMFESSRCIRKARCSSRRCREGTTLLPQAGSAWHLGILMFGQVTYMLIYYLTFVRELVYIYKMIYQPAISTHLASDAPRTAVGPLF